ncbi:MAG: helix-turn-helix transcriptional regulator [Verrucomicrobiaceae bacterium]|nr:helix-turn-helix transcriptional regulator [Verrucomicrobiaceae bacterium]
MATQRKYLNYTTPWGVDLARVATAGWTPFLIHESGYQPKLDGWNHSGVDSPFWRFYYNPKPGCHLRFQGQKIPLEPKTAILIPADTVFDCVGPVPACHYWLHFTTSRPGVSFPAAPMPFPVDDTMRCLLAQLIETHQSHADGHRLLHLASALLHVVFAKLNVPSQTLPERLSEVLALIARSPQMKLSNHFLAERAGMSIERFIRSFREHTGHTPAAYILLTRIRLAGEALALTDKTIDQIAIETGFPNRHYLSRMFARNVGCGPAEYRARQRERKGL